MRVIVARRENCVGTTSDRQRPTTTAPVRAGRWRRGCGSSSSLPVCRAPGTMAPGEVSSPLEGMTMAQRATRQPDRPLRVAVAEDDEAMAYWFRRALAVLGHEVLFVAGTGPELVEGCRTRPPDLI